MQLGMIGLGRMGANMVRRLVRGGHECVVYDVHADSVKALAREGAVGALTVDDLLFKLSKPRAVWMMVPVGIFAMGKLLPGLISTFSPEITESPWRRPWGAKI